MATPPLKVSQLPEDVAPTSDDFVLAVDNATHTSKKVTMGKVVGTVIDTDGTLTSNSDTKVASQKAVVTYVAAHAGGGGSGSGDMVLATAQTNTGIKTFNAGTFLDKGSQVYDVRAYGAVLDGTTNDLVAIQAAIDAATAVSGGDVLIVKPAFISGSIEMKDNVRLKGVKSRGVSLTSTMTSTNESGLINITGRTNVAIEDLKIVPNGSSTAITSYGHTGLYLRRLEITGTTNTTETVIQFSGGSSPATGVFANTVVDDCYIHDLPNTSNSIRLYARNGHTIDNTEIKNCTFKNVSRRCVMLDNYDFITSTYVHHNKFRDIAGDNTIAGVAVWTSIQQATQVKGLWVEDNDYQNTLSGGTQNQGFMQFYGTYDVRVVRNHIRGSWTVNTNTLGPALAPGRVRTPAVHTLIANNYIEAFDAAWDPDSMIDCEVTGNKVIRCAQEFTTGYGLQRDINIHHNYSYNSPHLGSVNALTAPGAADVMEKNVRLTDNVYVDDRPIPTPTGLVAALDVAGSLTGLTQYYYVVTACDPTGETVKSAEVTATTTNTIKKIRISWNLVDGASQYKIYRSTTTGTYGATSFLIAVNDYQYFDDGTVALTTGAPPSGSTVQTTPVVNALFFHGASTIDHSDTIIRNNKFYLPRGTFTDFLHKEFSDSIISRVVEGNEYEDSTGRYGQVVYSLGSLTGSNTITRANGSPQAATLTGNVTLTLTDGKVTGELLELVLTQDATGSRTVTFAGNVSFGGTFTASTTASVRDSITFKWDGTKWREMVRSVSDAAAYVDSAVVHKAGTETITGSKTFSSAVTLPAGGIQITDNNHFTFDDQTTYRRIQSFNGVPLAINPGGNDVIFNGTASLKTGSVSFTGQNIAQNGATVITNMNNALIVQTDTAQDIIFKPNVGEQFRIKSGGGLKLPTGTNGYVLTSDASGNLALAAPTGGTGITRSVSTITTTSTIGATALTDYVVFIGASGVPTLPTAVGNTNRYSIKNIDTTNKTLATTSSQTIDGSTTITLLPNDSVDLVSDNANWRVL